MSNPTMEPGMLFRIKRLWSFVVLVLMALIVSVSQAQTPQAAKPIGAALIPEPAVSAILAAFDKYEIVGMPEAHGLKDVDDFILADPQPGIPGKG